MGCLVALLLVMQYPNGFLQSLALAADNGPHFLLGGGLLLLLDTIAKALMLVVFVAVFITDLRTGYIPNRITYPAIVIAFVYLLVTCGL